MSNKALIIGVNQYLDPTSNLNGCIPDSYSIYKTLISGLFPFKNEEVIYLTNQNATKDNIIAHLEWLIRDRNSGDNTLIYYSGHGSHVPDTSGSEADGWTEILCPHDMVNLWRTPLTDRIIEKYLLSLPAGGKNVVIFDCCHSGTANMSRSIGESLSRDDVKAVIQQMGVSYLQRRYLQSPYDESNLVNPYEIRTLGRATNPNNNIHIDNTLPYVYISGCRDDQYSNEVGIGGGEPRGLMTYALNYLLSQQSGLSVYDLQRSMSSWFATNYGWADQNPQVHCSEQALYRPLL